eukprot:13282650-Alexandrium_andersonii.AAC.1
MEPPYTTCHCPKSWQTSPGPASGRLRKPQITWQGAQSAIGNPPKARQCCSPRQPKRLKMCPRNFRGVHSAPRFAHIPNLPTKGGSR